MSARSRVCLAISSFRNDESVIELVGPALASEYFDEILIVDSLGTGALPRVINERGWSERVHYENHSENLGSAGNLARRLALAAARGHEWVYAINHDGEVDAGVVRELVKCGESLTRIGAVYPLRYMAERKQYDLTGQSAFPLPFQGQRRRPTERIIDVHWASSNGALYALEPVRRGLLPWADLWMGWEDLGYGWLLAKSGYRQVVLTTVETHDTYEHQRKTVLRRTVTVTRKPAWYTYYQARNLILVTGRTEQRWRVWAVVAGRMLLELGVTTALRPEKRARYSLLMRGTLDGWRKRSGKWALP